MQSIAECDEGDCLPAGDCCRGQNCAIFICYRDLACGRWSSVGWSRCWIRLQRTSKSETSGVEPPLQHGARKGKVNGQATADGMHVCTGIGLLPILLGRLAVRLTRGGDEVSGRM